LIANQTLINLHHIHLNKDQIQNNNNLEIKKIKIQIIFTLKIKIFKGLKLMKINADIINKIKTL
jgi:hypothetical protein